MVKQITKVVYKPDSQSTEEYTMIVDAVEYKKWKDGDTSIPLSFVVDSFDVFVSTQGKQGKLGRASKQQLETIFGTSNEDEVAKKLLTEGSMQAGDSLHDDRNIKNLAHGGYQMDLKGSGAHTSGV